jgi:hypothetical protein
MAKHTVTGQVQPAQGLLVSKESTRHPALRDMPGSRGAAFAGVPAPTRNQRVTPKRSVRNVPEDGETGIAPRMPVPPAAVYEEPPARVVAAKSDHPTWLS